MTEETSPNPYPSKAQFEFEELDDGTVSVNVYDPVLLHMWQVGMDEGIPSLIDYTRKHDASSPVVQLTIQALVNLSFSESVSAIKDVRTDKTWDVSNRNPEEMMERFFGKGNVPEELKREVSGRSSGANDPKLQAQYDKHVAMGIVPDDFSFEDWKAWYMADIDKEKMN